MKPWLTTPDTRFDETGHYKTNLILNNKDSQSLKTQINAEIKKSLTLAKEKAKGKAVKQAPSPFEDELIDGKPSGNVIFKFKTKAKIITKDGKAIRTPDEYEEVTETNSRIYKDNNIKTEFNTFGIGIKGATDLEYSQRVADYIGSKHHQIVCTEENFLNAIPEVIYSIESYDITTVRASVGNYLVGKYIKENTDITVVFNGDGSDEQSGYYYLRKGINNAINEDEKN